MREGFKHDPSSTAAFEKISAEHPEHPFERVRAVVIGGGTGAPLSIRTLLSMGVKTSAVVAMADDGGSTGDLRAAADVTPPGDIRKCLAAFAADPNDPMTQAFKYRFEFANNHTLGNLMLSALENATGSFPRAIEICEELLGARGHVYPSTLDKIVLCGRDQEGQTIEGQALLSHSRTALSDVWLKVPNTGTPYPAAIKAICEADLIVLGPGSLFTSIIPNLLIPGVIEAIASSRARKLFVCSLADMQGETRGLTAEEHVRALEDHGMAGMLDYVLVHTPRPLVPGGADATSRGAGGARGALNGRGRQGGQPTRRTTNQPVIRPVRISYESAVRIQESGPVVIARNLADPTRPTWHDPLALREAFSGVLKQCLSPQI